MSVRDSPYWDWLPERQPAMLPCQHQREEGRCPSPGTLCIAGWCDLARLTLCTALWEHTAPWRPHEALSPPGNTTHHSYPASFTKATLLLGITYPHFVTTFHRFHRFQCHSRWWYVAVWLRHAPRVNTSSLFLCILSNLPNKYRTDFSTIVVNAIRWLNLPSLQIRFYLLN